MEDFTNLHSADGSFLGFLYQIERAIIWLSSASNDAIVGVEVDDDISIKLTEGQEIKNIYEQAKHSQTRKVPYSDQSIDLWKTLSIWIEAVESGRIDVEKSKFSMITNKKIPPNRIVMQLGRAYLSNKSDMSSATVKLKETAMKLPVSMTVYKNRVLNCSVDVLKNIIDKIIILDGTYSHNNHDIKKEIRNNMSMSDDLPFDYIYRSLFGFVADSLIEKWRNKENGWIKVSSFNQQYTQLVADFKKKSFYEQTVESLPISNKDIERNKGRIFVEQLHLIGCSEEEVIEAINDFIRAASERSRLAQDGEISAQKFEMYFDDLLNYWKSISRPKFKFANESNYPQIGYQVYYDCIVYKGKLNSFEPEQGYTYRGSYHYLSDQIRLGWHPQWQNLNKKKKDGTK